MNDRRKKFIDALMTDPGMTGASAAIAAGYSPRTARQQASRLLTNADVQNALATRRKERAERIKIDADDVIGLLAGMAAYDPNDMFEADGTIKNISAMPPEARAAIAGISLDDQGRIRNLKLADRGKAIDMLGRHLGIFKSEAEEAGSDFIEVLTKAQKRVEAMRALNKQKNLGHHDE